MPAAPLILHSQIQVNYEVAYLNAQRSLANGIAHDWANLALEVDGGGFRRRHRGGRGPGFPSCSTP